MLHLEGSRLGHDPPLAPGQETSGPGAAQCWQLIPMQDQITNGHFLMDTSASYSIIPHGSSLPAPGPKLFGQRVSSFLAGETACSSFDSRIRIFHENLY